MKKRFVQALMTCLLTATFAAAFAACSSDGEESKYDVLVTFNYNVSHLLDTVSCKTQYLGLKKGGLAVEPGNSQLGNKFVSGEVQNKYIEGWYLAETDPEGRMLDTDGDLFRNDKDGNAIKTDEDGFLLAPDGETYLKTEEDKRIFLSPLGLLSQEADNDPYSMNNQGFVNSLDGKTAIRDKDGEPIRVTRVEVKLDLSSKWDFKTNRVEEDVTLYARYIDKPSIRVLDAETGDEVKTYYGDPGVMAYDPPGVSDRPSKEGYSLYGIYEDAAHTQPFTFGSYRYPAAEEIGEDGFPVKTVYAYFIEGRWEFVRTPEQLVSALASPTNRIWLDTDITYTSAFNGANKSFNGELNGNKHVISGISVDRTASRNDPTDTGFGIFGKLGESAYIHDVTFRNVTYKFVSTVSRNYHLGLLAGIAEEGARIERVNISGTLEFGEIEDAQRLSYGKLIGTDRGATVTDTDDGNITLTGAPEQQ